MSQNLERDGVDAGLPRVLARSQRRQLMKEGARQVAADVGDLGRDEVEIVEEPFSGRRHELAGSDVVRQGAIGVAQNAGVVLEPGEDVARSASARIDREAGGERQGTLFESFDAEKFVSKWLLGWRRTQPTRTEAHEVSGLIIATAALCFAATGAAHHSRPRRRPCSANSSRHPESSPS